MGSGRSAPTLKQAEDFASATHTPIGMLLLAEAPVDAIPPARFPYDSGHTGGAPKCRLEPSSGCGVVAYLLDANVFIQAKNLYYGFDFCPAFWEWLVGWQRKRPGLQPREGRR